MRELNFLPQWYPAVLRRRRATIAQAWATLGLCGAMLLWAGVAKYRAFVATHDASVLRSQSAALQGDLARLDTLVGQQRRWSEQGEMLSNLGVSVESTRLLSMISAATPADVSLTGLNLSTEEKPATVQTVSMAKSLKEPPVDRLLRVHLLGVSPSDTDVADLMAKLSAVPFLQDVAIGYTRDAEQAGHLMREFDVSFGMSLNLESGN